MMRSHRRISVRLAERRATQRGFTWSILFSLLVPLVVACSSAHNSLPSSEATLPRPPVTSSFAQDLSIQYPSQQPGSQPLLMLTTPLTAEVLLGAGSQTTGPSSFIQAFAEIESARWLFIETSGWVESDENRASVGTAELSTLSGPSLTVRRGEFAVHLWGTALSKDELSRVAMGMSARADEPGWFFDQSRHRLVSLYEGPSDGWLGYSIRYRDDAGGVRATLELLVDAPAAFSAASASLTKVVEVNDAPALFAVNGRVSWLVWQLESRITLRLAVADVAPLDLVQMAEAVRSVSIEELLAVPQFAEGVDECVSLVC